MTNILIAAGVLGVEVVQRICDLLGIRGALGPHVETMGIGERCQEAHAVEFALIESYLQSIVVGMESRCGSIDIGVIRKLRVEWPRGSNRRSHKRLGGGRSTSACAGQASVNDRGGIC